MIDPLPDYLCTCVTCSDQGVEMTVVDETLCVNLVEIFGPRGARGEPAIFGDDFKAADGRVVAWGVRQLGGDFLTCHV